MYHLCLKTNFFFLRLEINESDLVLALQKQTMRQGFECEDSFGR